MINNKITYLNFFLVIFTIIYGFCLGSIDLFGLLNGGQSLNLILIFFSLVSIYAIVILVFLFNCAQQQKIDLIFITDGLIFTAAFFIANFNILSSIAIGLIFYLFIHYSYFSVYRRSKLFIKFLPKEIFFPVIRNSFIYILIFFSAITFFQTNDKVANNQLITPHILRIFFKPAIESYNQQFNNKLQTQLGDKYSQFISSQQRNKIIEEIIKESFKSIINSDLKKVVVLNENQIPYHKVIISEDGQIDISPIVDELYPEIAMQLNNKIKQFSFIVPLVLALIVALIARPIFWIIAPIEFGFTYVIFKILTHYHFITIRKQQGEIEVVTM